MADEVLTYSFCSGSALGNAEWAEVSAYYHRAYASSDYWGAICHGGTRLVAVAYGLAVKEVRFARAGFGAEVDVSTGKEILLITKRIDKLEEGKY